MLMAKGLRANVPALNCSMCEMPVLIVELAVVSFPAGIVDTEVVTARVLHKGRCFEAAELRVDNSQPHAEWMELSRFLADFAANSARLVRDLASDELVEPCKVMQFARKL